VLKKESIDALFFTGNLTGYLVDNTDCITFNFGNQKLSFITTFLIFTAVIG